MTKTRVSLTAVVVSSITAFIVALVVSLAVTTLANADTATPATGRETSHAARICTRQFNGRAITLPSGLRPDCITAFAVIEFDWAKNPKHYECIGQAITYATQTGKLPVCVLLARNASEHAFAIQQRPAMHRAGVALQVIDVFEGR